MLRILSQAVDRARVPLYRNALVLMGNTGLTAGLGFVFWALAARLYPPAELGLASAAISSALFVATLSLLGLPYALVRFSPSAAGGLPVVTTTIAAVVALVSALVGIVFLTGINTWASSLAGLAPIPILGLAVITLAAATGVSTVLVYASVSARDTAPALAGGVTQSVVKSALLLGFAIGFSHVGFAVVLAWLLGTLAAVCLQVWLMRSRIAPRVDLQLIRPRTFVRYSAGNWVGDLAWTAPGLLFPLIVVALLGAEANAYFFVAWAIASLLAGIPTAVATSLLAEGTHAQSETGEHLRRAVRFTLPLVVAAIVVCFVGAPVILGLFGAPYAVEGVDTLRLLSLAALPLSLNLLYLTVARVDRDIRRIVAITAVTGGVALVLGTALVPAFGEPGIALGYLAAHTIVAIPLTLEWLVRGPSRP